MTSKRVRTINISETELIKQIRTTFGLNEVPFDTLDDDFILLVFIPTCKSNRFNLPRPTLTRLRTKFGTCDHQTLEFYGDRVFYDILATILYDLFGLNNTPNFLTKLSTYLASNRFITDLMLNKNACKYLRSKDYFIYDTTPFHNQCGDAFEALIGALFIHLNSLGLNYVQYITDWILKNTNIAFFIKQYLIDMGINTSSVYTVNDKEALIQRYKERRESLLSNLEDLKEDLGEELYLRLKKSFEEESLEVTDFATKAVIADPGDDLSTIYQKLGWIYNPATLDVESNMYHVIGYPSGKSKVIGSGLTPDEASSDAYDYLVTMGYIIIMKSPTKYFTF